MTTAHAWLEARFGEIRPKALAALARQFRDLDLAEEAFAASCEKALRVWPEQGLPDHPLAWLLTVARNSARDRLRRRAVALAHAETEVEEAASAAEPEAAIDEAGLRDDVLRLLFICCHPELSTQDQAALALRVVAGMRTAEIARAFLASPKAMEQRLTRAKRAVARAEMAFETPSLSERHHRLRTVSLMLYLLFSEGWSASAGEMQVRAPLCVEAIRLARLLLSLFPSDAELMGLLALFLLQHSRRDARLDADGELAALESQDRALWDRAMIAEAQALLEKALRRQTVGPYQIQAAIAAAHARAPSAWETDWAEIARLYGALALIQPTPVVRLNHAVAVAEVEGPQAGLALMAPLAEALGGYRWFHAARGGLLAESGAPQAAREAYARALELDPTEPERRHLLAKIADCEKFL